MGKRILLIVILLLVLFGGLWIIDYLALFQKIKTSENFTNPTLDLGKENVSYKVEIVAGNLSIPWSLVFTSEDRLVFTERRGTIREIRNGTLTSEPLLRIPDVDAVSEAGLMGLEIDPDYQNNKYLYTSYAYDSPTGLKVKIVRLIDNDTEISIDKIILDNIPAASNHAGSRIKFGPDGKLYVTTGDATQKNLAQNLNSLAGKILRMNSDGTIPEDNPYKNSFVYSYGHRNPQGIAWNNRLGTMYSTEHGPSVFDGPAGGDEVNVIFKGGNYGWPVVSHDKSQEGMVDPIQVYTPAVAPASALIYSGKMFPQFKDNLFFGGLRGEGLFRLILEGKALEKVNGFQKIPEVTYGRIRDVVEGPTGEIYFSTSNRDGRGDPRENDDKIYKITAE